MTPARVLFSSQRNDWATPRALYYALVREFGPFDLDPCAGPGTALAPCAYAPPIDGRRQMWWGNVFVNPPYGRELAPWIAKCWRAVRHGPAHLVVALVPARTDTAWWHEYVLKADEIRFLRGRLRFDDGHGRATFPSVIVIWRSSQSQQAAAGAAAVIA